MNLNDLSDAVYEDAVAHGLWENDAYWCDDEGERQREMRCQAAYMIKSEVRELIDVANVDVCKDTDHIEHYTEELADVIIMSLSVAGKLGIDIDAAVKAKMEINKARPWKHGRG
jgi:NTP pyrophosphatase (non-canonical NTP hydrolase)